MRRHLNTLYVTSQGTYLATEGETVVAKADDEVKLRVPLHMLEGIVGFGRVSASPFLLGKCAERGIGISFLTERGRFLARVQGAVSGNVLLRRTQYRRADDDLGSAELARAFVTSKLVNTRTVLRRALRDHRRLEGWERVESAAGRVARAAGQLSAATTVDSIRGIEGDAARTYFDVFDHLILHQKDTFRFGGRSRRPPTDAVNALLSFLYTLLLHDGAYVELPRPAWTTASESRTQSSSAFSIPNTGRAFARGSWKRSTWRKTACAFTSWVRISTTGSSTTGPRTLRTSRARSSCRRGPRTPSYHVPAGGFADPARRFPTKTCSAPSPAHRPADAVSDRGSRKRVHNSFAPRMLR